MNFCFCENYYTLSFLLFCHNKRPSYELDFIIEDPYRIYFHMLFTDFFSQARDNKIVMFQSGKKVENLNKFKVSHS